MYFLNVYNTLLILKQNKQKCSFHLQARKIPWINVWIFINQPLINMNWQKLIDKDFDGIFFGDEKIGSSCICSFGCPNFDHLCTYSAG